jgi:hypothetical protein
VPTFYSIYSRLTQAMTTDQPLQREARDEAPPADGWRPAGSNGHPGDGSHPATPSRPPPTVADAR